MTEREILILRAMVNAGERGPAIYLKALRLALTAEAFVDHVDGKRVPKSSLDPYWLRAYRVE